MDLTSIEATSVAIRAGQAVASELCRLLSSEEALRPIEDWFSAAPEPVAQGEGRAGQVARFSAVLDRLGGYICHSADPVSGERLYRWALREGLIVPLEWAEQPFLRRQCFEAFAATVRHIHAALKAEQDKLEASGRPPPQQQSLALEDSIFEPEEPFGAIREEFRGLKPPPAPAPAATSPAAPKAKAPAAPALSVGEPPPRPPENRGGRGNRKNR